LLSGIALTFIYAWVFNNTKGSVLLVILLHASVDAFFVSQLFFAPIVSTLLPFTIGFGAVALAIIVFTRGRLGYDHYLQEEEATEEPDVATAQT
jgi:hypothetical protein